MTKSQIQSQKKPTAVIASSAIFALSLLVMLFPAPQPRMISNHTWRAELITTLAIFGIVLTDYFRGHDSVLRLFRFRTSWMRTIAFFMAAFAVWGMLSAFWSPGPFPAWHHTLLWIEYLFCFLIVLNRLDSSAGISSVSEIFVWLAAVIGVLCLIDYATLPDFQTLEGTLRARYSSYAELLVAALPIIWAVSIYSRNRKNYLIALAAGVLGWMTVMLSLSKGAFIAGVAGFTIMFLGSLVFGLKQFRRRTIVSLGVWLIVTVAVQVGFSFLTTVPATIDYISGKADATRETSLARVLVWNVGAQMVRDNWLFGVGADNFGISFNEARAKYRVSHPDNPRDEVVGINLVERSHNEMLQITAELGVVGLALVLIPVFIFLTFFIRALWLRRFSVSPMLWAAVGGMAAFGLSSMVSSFSLRIVQNGIVFFIVFAVAAHEIGKCTNSAGSAGIPAGQDREAIRRESFFSRFQTRVGYAGAGTPVLPAVVSTIFVLILLTLSLKAVAEYYVFSADHSEDNASAINLYHAAARLDPDYKAAYLRSSGRSFVAEDYAAAAGELRKAIDGGLGVILTYSALADCETKTGDLSAAAGAFTDGLRIYPRSVFLRVRYATLLKKMGREAEATSQIALARSIDARQADGWYSLLKNGSVIAFYAAQNDPSLAAPSDLRPEVAVLQFLDKAPDSQNREQ